MLNILPLFGLRPNESHGYILKNWNQKEKSSGFLPPKPQWRVRHLKTYLEIHRGLALSNNLVTKPYISISAPLSFVVKLASLLSKGIRQIICVQY